MGADSLLSDVQQSLDLLRDQQLLRSRREVDSPCSPHVLVNGRDMLAFCSNDYLGLAAHPLVIDALAEGARIYGAGSGASHMVSGHSRAHVLLEERLAGFLSPHVPSARSLSFSTGYMANLAILSGLTALKGADHTAVFSEELNHASLIDGMRLARGAVTVYPHRDTRTLERQLAQCTARTRLVVTDSVFSMDGDVAPLDRLLSLCQRYDAWLIVDDAHGFGVLGGSGRGALEHFGLRSERLIYMGTLGKAAGVAGAFVCAHDLVIEWLVQRARPYIYTTAASPALAHALLSSIQLIEGAEGRRRRAHLAQLVKQFREGLRLSSWKLVASDTAIQPIVVGSNEQALRVSMALEQQGLWVPAIRPPTVAEGTARLRVTLSAGHTGQQVQTLVDAINHLQASL